MSAPTPGNARGWNGLRRRAWKSTRFAPLFLLLTAVPLFVANINNEIAVRKIKVSELETELTTWVAMVVSERGQIFAENIRGIEQLIDSGFVKAGTQPCQGAMVWLSRHLPTLQRILVVDDTGTVRCASRSEDVGESLAAHTIFREALAGEEMTRQAETLFPNSRQPENAFAKSFVTNHGQRGVVVSLSDSSWLRQIEIDRPLPEGGRLYVSDLAGNIVNRAPLTPPEVRRLPAYLTPLLSLPTGGTRNMIREDGHEMIVRYALPEDPMDHIMVIMVLDRGQALARIDAATRNSVMVSVFILVGSLLIAGIGLAGFLRHRDRVNSTLRQNEQRLRLALEAARAGSFEYHPDTGRVVASPDFYLMMGLIPADGETRTEDWVQAIHPDDRDRVIEEFRDALRSHTKRIRFEYRVLQSGGSLRWIETISQIFRNPDGTPTRMSGLCIDTTDHKRLELDLRAAKDEAERATVAKSRFLAAASHDLRQPMQSLFLFAEALKRHLDAFGQDKLAQLVRSLDALKMLLDSLLDVSKLDAGLIEPTVENFALCDVVDDLSAAYSSVAATRGLSWRVNVPPVGVRSDRVLLARLLRNLLENAVRYTNRGGIELRAMLVDDKVHIEVADSGIGIADSERDQIFEEFFQVGNVERNRQQGLGLGLAIVRRIADLLGHEVSLHSAPGRGSIFTIIVPEAEIPETIPGGQPAVAALPAALPPDVPTIDRVDDHAGTGNSRSEPWRVVVIDDEVLVLLGMEAILQEQGFVVITASSSEEALAKLKDSGQVPDIILADYRLGRGQLGTDAIAALRAYANSPVPAFLLTGETAADTLREASSNELTVLNKPITARQLMAALAVVTDR